ncbi:hypothetical protein TWF696_005431 [Orbilia brochopaga]|uniref:Uncharacterized protein n=1 Tax=Orbilia brochopaga TaxID=3140254 RepID=A0AAV9V0S2_9PEZI
MAYRLFILSTLLLAHVAADSHKASPPKTTQVVEIQVGETDDLEKPETNLEATNDIPTTDQINQEIETCNQLRRSDYKDLTIRCESQPKGPKQGVNIAELSTFITRNWTVEMNNAAFIVAGNDTRTPRCHQVYCIGEYATLNICSIRTLEAGVSATVTGKQLRDAMVALRDIMWPERPWEATEDDPATYSTMAVVVQWDEDTGKV